MNKLRRKALTMLTLATAVVGIAMLLVPFGLSLFPNDRAYAALPRFDISDILPGTYKLATLPKAPETFNGFKQSVYFIKTQNGDLRAWVVYAKNGEIGMPDYHWWQTYYTCREFGPDLKDGVIDENSLIRCHDKDPSPGFTDHWRWKLDGKAISQYIDDMQPAGGEVEGHYFVLGKKH